MRIWIICSGEASVAFPQVSTLAEYNALREHALDGGVEKTRTRRVATDGRTVLCSPRLSARETAEMTLAKAEAETEELLDELPRPIDSKGRVLPLWMWRFLMWLRRLLGLDRAKGLERAGLLINRLESGGKDCILISHPAMISALIETLRLRGYCVQRTGMGGIKPLEQMLLSRRDEHCGGCQHNCLLSNPGCNIGRDKAARMKKKK